MKTHWKKVPNTKDKVIKLLRNFCSDEFSSEYIYPEGPYLKDWSVNGVLHWIEKNGSKAQYDEILKLYNEVSVNSVLPFATTIHHFLETNDSKWYKEVYMHIYNQHLSGLKK